MKIAIFSDVHGNIYAFKKIIESIKNQKVNICIFCGDICGYYYYQNEVIQILREIDHLYLILGNHDKWFLDIYEGKYPNKLYTEKYGKSMELLRNNITEENLAFLRTLREKEEIIIDQHKIGIFHGNPWNHLEGYIYPNTPIEEFKNLKYDYIILGHTHYPMYRKVDDKIIINPGSCGQPRDGEFPSYAILDLNTEAVEFINIEYDRTPLIKDIIKNNEKNKYLIDILFRRR